MRSLRGLRSIWRAGTGNACHSAGGVGRCGRRKAGAWLAALAICGPAATPAVAQSGPGMAAPPTSGAIAPRQDVYTQYADGYHAGPTAGLPGAAPMTGPLSGLPVPGGPGCPAPGQPGAIGPAFLGGGAYGAGSAQEMQKAFRPGRYSRIYFSNDVVYMQRDDTTDDVVFVAVTQNLFDFNLDGTPNALQVNAQTGPVFDGVDFPLFPTVTPSDNSILEFRPGRPDDNDVLQVFFPPGPAPAQMPIPNPDGTFSLNGVFANDGTYLGNIGQNFNPGDPILTSDQFGINFEVGYRPTIGIEFRDGAAIEFSYMALDDFTGDRLTADVAGSAFLTKQLSSPNMGVGQGPRYGYFRFGYLDGGFGAAGAFQGFTGLDLTDPVQARFAGEDRRGVQVNPVTGAVQFSNEIFPGPHHPYVESPPLADPLFKATGLDLGILPPFIPMVDENGLRGIDIPREPTADDTGTSQLFIDGEAAAVTYSHDYQHGDLTYRKPLFDWWRDDWQVTLVGGLRWAKIDEAFGLFFADIAGTDAIINAEVPSVNPTNGADLSVDRGFDRRETNFQFFGRVDAQPSIETYAFYDNSIDQDIIGPVIGLEAKRPFWDVFAVTLMMRGGLLANFQETRTIISRGDGFALFDRSSDAMDGTGLLEGRFGVDYVPHPNVVLSGGLEFMQYWSVGTAISGVDSNLSASRRPANEEDLLYSGFFGGLEVKF